MLLSAHCSVGMYHSDVAQCSMLSGMWSTLYNHGRNLSFKCWSMLSSMWSKCDPRVGSSCTQFSITVQYIIPAFPDITSESTVHSPMECMIQMRSPILGCTIAHCTLYIKHPPVKSFHGENHEINQFYPFQATFLHGYIPEIHDILQLWDWPTTAGPLFRFLQTFQILSR